MNCDYFGICGSCTLGDMSYEEQLKHKIDENIKLFEDFDMPKDIDIIKSDDEHFRNRAEFRIFRTYEKVLENGEEKEIATLNYAMNDTNKKALIISKCGIVSKNIADLMPKILYILNNNDILKFKLFSIEFMSSSTDMLVTLIYHSKLKPQWEAEAIKLEKELGIRIIGRSKGQKIVLSDDFVQESFEVSGKSYKFVYFENGFMQPNSNVNAQMLNWVLNNTKQQEDLCELYCGGGNFTIALSEKFKKVLATEISKTSIKCAKINAKNNDITNIEFLRMSSEEFGDALNEVREFRRLKDINLKDYNFSSIFVDPPRAGVDELTLDIVKEFENIIYISCNPTTLSRDLEFLTKTHKIEKFAFFDQFVYTHHIECGVILTKK